MAVIAIVSAALVACGSSETAVVAPQDAVAPVAVAADTTQPAGSNAPGDAQASVSASADESAESQAVAVQPADTEAGAPVETREMAIVDLVLVDDPALVEALKSEADPQVDSMLADATTADSTQANLVDADSVEAESTEAALLTSYTDYGFALKLDLGADVQTAGWTEPQPSLTQGILAFSYSGVNANLVWGPPEDRTALTFLADTYNILRASQPAVTFESISDGDVSISDQSGVFGGFKAIDDSGAAVGGGLIGAWICGDSETAFRMTLTGEDATIVQLRFDRLLENFACSSS